MGDEYRGETLERVLFASEEVSDRPIAAVEEDGAFVAGGRRDEDLRGDSGERMEDVDPEVASSPERGRLRLTAPLCEPHASPGARESVGVALAGAHGRDLV